jgi:hypothetical protein
VLLHRLQTNTYGQVKCRVCGCTDRIPCNPPCNRVEEGLCSTCLEAARALLYWRQRAFKPGPNALWMELNRLYRRDLALAQESGSAPKISVILPPAPPLEAMMDQLEYLANHASGRVCPDNCWACVRLREAEDLLLKPFMQTA